MKMRDAKAEHAKYQYWVYFEFAIQLVLSYLEPGIAAYIQEDFNSMDDKIQIMKQTPGLSEKTREMTTDLFHEEFADRHRYYILKALNKIGIVKVSEDGDIDFGKLDLQVMSEIIRSSSNIRSVATSTTESAIQTSKDIDARMAGITEISKGPADLTLVMAQGKIYKMGTQDYKKYVDTRLDEKIAEAKKAEEELAQSPDIPEKKIETSMPDMPSELPMIGWQPRKPFQTIPETDGTVEEENAEETAPSD